MFRVTYKEASQAPKSKLEILPVEYRFKPLSKRLAVLDTETDPFAIDPLTGKARRVEAFDLGFYDGERHYEFWGDDCVDQFFEWLATRNEEEFCICVHNGGNFDFYMMLDHMDAGTSPFIMDGRIVRMEAGGQEFRDSYKLIPVALGEYQKDVFNYAKMERWFEGTFEEAKALDKPDEKYTPSEALSEYLAERHPYEWVDKVSYSPREHFKDRIQFYRRHDCEFLYDLCHAAFEEFGDKLTMASVALPKLRSFHGFNTMGEETDESLRRFYFGGRCEAFELGELYPENTDEWVIYDVNSMYPFVMANYLHPISCVPILGKYINEGTHFARIYATSRGALPIRADDGSLAFPHGRGTFYACIHELRAAQELGLLDIHRVDFTVSFEAEAKFTEFVNHFYTRRLEADAAGDKIRKLFWKLVLNSSYGKLAQDPRKYERFLFDPHEYPLPLYCDRCARKDKDDGLCDGCKWGISAATGWRLHTSRQSRVLFAAPQEHARHSSFFNVATAASITSAARAELLRGLSRSVRPIYCDTDSVICERFDGACDAHRLGAWKREASGTVAYIAAKKLYAVFNQGSEVKKASKGVKLTADQIARVAAGETIVYANPVPKFNLDGSFSTIERTIRRAADGS